MKNILNKKGFFKGRDSEKGSSVIDIMLWSLGAMAVAGVIYTTYQSFMTNNTIKDHLAGLRTLDSGVSSLYKKQRLRNYTGISAAAVSQTIATPAGWKNGLAITNEWNSDLVLAAAPGNTFSITDPGVPEEECTEIMVTVYNDFKESRVGGAAGALVTDVVSAATACVPGSNTLFFVHK